MAETPSKLINVNRFPFDPKQKADPRIGRRITWVVPYKKTQKRSLMRKMMKVIPAQGKITLSTLFSPGIGNLQARIIAEFTGKDGEKLDLVFDRFGGVLRSRGPYCLEVQNMNVDKDRNLELVARWIKQEPTQKIEGALVIKIIFFWNEQNPDTECVLNFHWAKAHQHAEVSPSLPLPLPPSSSHFADTFFTQLSPLDCDFLLSSYGYGDSILSH